MNAGAGAPCAYCLACDAVGAVLDPVAGEPARPDRGLPASPATTPPRPEDAHEYLHLLLHALGERSAAVCECSVCLCRLSTREPLLDLSPPDLSACVSTREPLLDLSPPDLSLPVARPEVDSARVRHVGEPSQTASARAGSLAPDRNEPRAERPTLNNEPMFCNDHPGASRVPSALARPPAAAVADLIPLPRVVRRRPFCPGAK